MRHFRARNKQIRKRELSKFYQERGLPSIRSRLIESKKLRVETTRAPVLSRKFKLGHCLAPVAFDSRLKVV